MTLSDSDFQSCSDGRVEPEYHVTITTESVTEQQQVEDRKGLWDVMRTMAKVCGLREDFLTDLLFVESSDWSFVIKAHALLESVVCQLLAVHLQKPALEEFLAQVVEMEGRISMLKALEITTDDERKMMRALGRLRNTLVHNAK